MAAPLSATITVGALVLPEVTVGKMDASITLSDSTPWTLSRESTTERAESGPIMHVDVG